MIWEKSLPRKLIKPGQWHHFRSPSASGAIEKPSEAKERQKEQDIEDESKEASADVLAYSVARLKSHFEELEHGTISLWMMARWSFPVDQTPWVLHGVTQWRTHGYCILKKAKKDLKHAMKWALITAKGIQASSKDLWKKFGMILSWSFLEYLHISYLYIYIYIYIYICIYVCMYVFTCIYIYTYTFIYTYHISISFHMYIISLSKFGIRAQAREHAIHEAWKHAEKANELSKESAEATVQRWWADG